MSTLGNFVGGLADQSLGVYRPHQYGGVTPPYAILRRLAPETPPNCTDWFHSMEKGGRR